MSVGIDAIKHSEIQVIPEHLHFNSLPLLVSQTIFSTLDLPDLCRNCFVCKRWKEILDEPSIWKRAIYNQSFNNKKWVQCFGDQVIKDIDEEVELSSLPDKILDAYKKFHRAYPQIKVKDGLMLVRVPKLLNEKLTINSLGMLAKQYFPETEAGYNYIWPAAVTALANKSIEESDWLLMTMDILQGSRCKTFAVQQGMVIDLAKATLADYEVPATLEAALCILAQYFACGIRLFNDTPTYIRCKENIQGCQMVVGGFAVAGLRVRNYPHDHAEDHINIGVAAVLKFKNNQVLE